MRSSNSARDAPAGRRLLFPLAGLLCVAVAQPAFAIDPNRAMSQYVRERWGADRGFPKGPVYAITQTADGYLWIGTESGLIRFDGWNFRTVEDSSGVFKITSVLGLTPDTEGCLWIRLQDLTTVRYCKGVFAHPSSDAESYSYISAMSRGSRGELLVSKMEDGAFGFRDGRFNKLASASDLPRSPVIALTQTANGDIWMGTRDAGLFRLGGGRTLSIRDGLPDSKVNCLLPEGDRQLWVGTDNGIVRWNGRQLTTEGIPASPNRYQALAMVKDRDANIWVGTDSRGLLRFNSQGVASLEESNSGQREAITALFEDREGNVWIGRASGIERLRDSAFVTYSLPEGLPSDGSNPVFADRETRIWFSPPSGGVWWVKGELHGKVSADGLDKDVVYSIAGKDDELWLGRQRGGLTVLRTGHGSFTSRTYTQAMGLAQDSIYSIYLARDGAVWAGTLSAGVSVFRDGRFTNYTVASGLASNTVASVIESSDGTMWFATPSGLSALSKGDWQTYGVRDRLPSENVNCLFQDSAGVLWAGTAAGVAFRGGQGFQTPLEVPASLHEPIFGLAEDRYGSLWIATSNHVLRVNRDKLMRGVLDEGDVHEYGWADGLRGMEGVKRNSSVVTDPAGRIWFSLNRGISVVDPGRLTGNPARGIAAIQTMSADGRPIGLGGRIEIPGGRQRIALGFAGLSLSVPDRVRFRYFLQGFDRAWSEPAATREAVYTNLPPGPYSFRVISSNPDGVWNSEEASLAFEVDPLFWQTWWFRISVVSLCAFAILAIYRLRLRELTRRLDLRFEERLGERTRIAQELHDTLLQGFLSASMHVHVAAYRLPADSEVQPILTRSLQLMGQVIEEGRNAVRGLRSSQSSSLDLEQAFSQIQQEFIPAKEGGGPVAFRVIVDGEPRPLHPVLRDEVYRIGREALVNAFRHAGAKKIEIELKYSSRNLRLLVRDDGHGIDPRILRSGREGHWGLQGMRERADRIGARLHLFSSSTAGTEIELFIPGHLAFNDERNHTLTWITKPFRRRSAHREPDTQNGNRK